ncbi:MAG: VOC family protein [Steroidobacteraceae bacterium]
MTATTARRPTFIPSVCYKDSRAALNWLESAFGFKIGEVLADKQGNIVHAEMTHGDGVIMVGSEWADWTRSPASVGGMNTQRVHVRIERGIEEHFAKAQRAGAKIIRALEDQFYGDRTYVATDPEGHYWAFAQKVRDVSNSEMEAATGFKFTGSAV